MGAIKEVIKFSRFIVTEQVFYKTKFTYALVNLRPLVPGHILVVPLRNVPRLKDLTSEESIDYIMTIQHIHRFIEHVYSASSLNIAIQDGPEAGQSVPHLHAHIIPRHKENNIGDKIYELIDDYDIEAVYKDFYERREQVKKRGRQPVKPDCDRIDRTEEEMTEEVAWLTSQLDQFSKLGTVH